MGECGPLLGSRIRQLTSAVSPAAGDLIPSAGPPPLRYLHVPVRILMYTQTLFKKKKDKVGEEIDCLKTLRITYQKDLEKLEEGGQFSSVDEKQFGDRKGLLFLKY